MKITRILPRSAAKAYQEYSIERLKANYEYHLMMAQGFRKSLDEAYEELNRLNHDQ
ncbi:MAG: hypothetical protein GWN01_13565 [Nitrosopumilaceae archaeon]|nr:hypothetical protein [Nitrosopumilaceae archaeon]NIU01892.1 hypothetical protein [Nitrosopumilaceae archaeon]NIU88296.1 hypothetical protein [Nitrosopumilaceae archaeon]NIV66588.1 hypothetical protein [Nitrosopumilaceae archaeon]NIX62493.1 hypothetical protein [Nitrosopumilaceae archaeon]